MLRAGGSAENGCGDSGLGWIAVVVDGNHRPAAVGGSEWVGIRSGNESNAVVPCGSKGVSGGIGNGEQGAAFDGTGIGSNVRRTGVRGAVSPHSETTCSESTCSETWRRCIRFEQSAWKERTGASHELRPLEIRSRCEHRPIVRRHISGGSGCRRICTGSQSAIAAWRQATVGGRIVHVPCDVRCRLLASKEPGVGRVPTAVLGVVGRISGEIASRGAIGSSSRVGVVNRGWRHDDG